MLEIREIGTKQNGLNLNCYELVKLMEEHPLDPMFEDCGNFIMPYKPLQWTAETKRYIGCKTFFGDFATINCRFYILTDEKTVIDKLVSAIRLNQEREDYRRLKKLMYR
ncbi:hypothetical protein [Pseudalkalibacillus caeni]|uniref:Uncharacterized protein n=1 Tax=Exobacillus caeni TaxID=2574798 RepID=A0A5R9F4W7_9BACL|nr:hypothetical protein [Pseudalkalibacillus caeni]TLS38772.1 hypothetical protein FCL54_00175 [Pseudalkalibacillus caeni]